MAYNFKTVDRESVYLLPPSLRDWLSEGHLAWFIIDAVEAMDISGFYRGYRVDGCGQSAYDPEAMVCLFLYSYCIGERSSRIIENACKVDVAFRVIMGNLQPDHTTICRFRAEHEEALRRLFIEVLRLCREGGLVKAGAIALDGTKIKANAALSANRDYDHLKKEVDRIFEEAKARDAEEDRLYGEGRSGNETPKEWATREGRQKWLREAKARLEAEAAAEAAAQTEKIARRQAEEEATGKKKRGRKPGKPVEGPSNEAKSNMTDPESRIMKTRTGYVQGYNAQAEVTQECNDVKQLAPILGKITENLAAAGAPGAMKTALADAGYWSDANMAEAGSAGPELLIATNKDWKQRKALREAPPPRGRIPAGMTPRDRMERKLLTARGRGLYKLRGKTIEPTFGQIKTGRGCDRFMRRGVKAAGGEWSLICATHNLLKLWRSGKAKFHSTTDTANGLLRDGGREIGRMGRQIGRLTEILAPVYA